MSKIKSNNKLMSKYGLLIWSSIIMIVLEVMLISAEEYLARRYSHTFERFTAFSALTDLHKNLIIGLQAIPDDSYSSDERANFAKITYKTYQQIQDFHPTYLKGGDLQVGYATLTDLNVPPPNDDTDIQLFKQLDETWKNSFVTTHQPVIESLKNITEADIIQSSERYNAIKAEAQKEVKNWEEGLIILDKIKNNLHDKANAIEKQQLILSLVGISVIILYFLLIGFLNFRKFIQTDRKLDSSLQENEDILNTVDSGLFLLDKELNIGNQYSKALTGILVEENIAGKNFTQLLENIVSQKDIETTIEFIEQLYNPRVKEKLINDLNPLRKIQVSLNDKKGETKEKYLDFGFARIYRGKEISHILVTANDITNAVDLEKRLENERLNNNNQTQMIVTVLNADGRMVRGFVQNCKQCTTRINNILKEPQKGTHVLDRKLIDMFREAHSLKGEASALDLKILTNQILSFEEEIKVLQNKKDLNGDDFLSLTVKLDDIIESVKTVDLLSKRLGMTDAQSTSLQSDILAEQIGQSTYTGLASINENNSTPENDVTLTFKNHDVKQMTDNTKSMAALDDVGSVQNQSQILSALQAGSFKESESLQAKTSYQEEYFLNFVEKLAERANKHVQFNSDGLQLLEDQTEKQRTLKEIALQLLRNSVVHGIEEPSERLAYAKPEFGVVKLKVTKNNQILTLVVEDDGNGIDYDKIRAKAIASGKFDEATVQTWSKKQLLSLIFSSGFSTADSVSEDAGQGVGLDVVKNRIMQIGAKLKIDTETKQFTRFTISCEE